MVYNYLIFIIILILFIITNKYLVIQENYDKYFTPFYNVESNLLRDFYKNDDYNKSFFKHKINYNEVYIYSNNNGYMFLKKFNDNLLQNSLIAKTNLYKLNNYNENIKYLLQNDNSITNITLPIYLKEKTDKINLVCNLNDIYLINITKLKYRIYSINDITYKTKIGILNQKNTIYFYYEKIFNDINIDYNKNNIIIYDNVDKMYDDLMNNKIEIIMYFSELPNEKLNNLINIDFMNELIILPFDLNKKKKNIFFIKNDFTKIKYFDLNKITQSYLPKKFGSNYYFTYKPNIKLLTIKEFLICNKKINNNLIEDIFKFTLNYRKKFDNTPYQIDKIEPSYELIKYIPYHPVVLKVFREYGYITNINSNNCKFFVGKKECTEKLLENTGLN